MLSKKKEKPRADEELHKENTKPEPEPVTEFEIKKGVNPYNFVHFPKRVIPSLPFKPGLPLKARIEGDALILTAKDEA